jgi:predicted DCC family thiol-disulfide oxidoreductase YuxK
VCQAFVSWLRLLDRKRRVLALPITLEVLAAVHPDLAVEECLRELHVITPENAIRRGWEAVATLARLFPSTWLIGALGVIPPFSWMGRLAYRFLARNRYAVSKCRGGACGSARPDEVRKKTFFGTFWSCYLIGLFVRLPLIVAAGLRDFFRQWTAHARTFRRRIDFPGGKLSILFLGGVPCDVVPLLFGELFTAVLYDGLLIDPGSPRMRGSLARHLRRLPTGTVRAIVASHHHEEHVGNLNWAAEKLSVPLYLGKETAALLKSPWRLPFVRSAIIGQPDPLLPPYDLLSDCISAAHGDLRCWPHPAIAMTTLFSTIAARKF